jgi:sodium transport system permease protein
MIFTIFKKELKETLRDRRTLLTMFVIPLLLFPVLLNIIVSVSSHFTKEAASRTIKIGIVGDASSELIDHFRVLPTIMGKKKLLFFNDTTELLDQLKKDSIQLGIVAPTNMNALLKELKQVPIQVYYDATNVGMKERGEVYLKGIEKTQKTVRYAQLKINPIRVEPIKITYNNTASEQEMLGKLAGGILPYVIIIFGFIGCVYPVIDLFTGEKERGTIETLLTTPLERWQLLLGKMGVVVLSGLIASTASLLGLFIAIELIDFGDNKGFLAVVHSMLNPTFILLLYSLLVPLTVFFAGVLVPIAIYAKSFKEAQSIITPLNIVVVLPTMVGFLPGIELNVLTACIPVVNCVLSIKELMAGTLEFGLVIESLVVMILFAFAAVYFSYKRFEAEENIVS